MAKCKYNNIKEGNCPNATQLSQMQLSPINRLGHWKGTVWVQFAPYSDTFDGYLMAGVSMISSRVKTFLSMIRMIFTIDFHWYKYSDHRVSKGGQWFWRVDMMGRRVPLREARLIPIWAWSEGREFDTRRGHEGSVVGFFPGTRASPPLQNCKWYCQLKFPK